MNLKGWVAIRIKPRQEKRAKENLLKQGFSCYFPTMFSSKIGSQKVIEVPMFPGYGFVKIKGNKSVLPIKSTLGVVGVVHFGSYYPVMDSKILKSFRSLEKFSAENPIVNISPGDEVKILKGPLKGLNGIVSSVNKDRIEVLYTLLNQSHKALLNTKLVDQR